MKSSPAWKALQSHHRKIAKRPMRALFEDDPNRFERFSLGQGGLFLDYSKNRITQDTKGFLRDLAREADVEGWRARLFRGDAVNVTEGRAVLHPALRDPGGDAPGLERGAVGTARDAMARIAGAIRAGEWSGVTGRPVTAVVNIGTGGSHQGPALLAEALAADGETHPEIRFAANVDGAAMTRALKGLSPAETLFVVVSKSFATEETIANAATAKAWIADALGADAAGRHFVAVTARPEAARVFGVAPDKVLPLWDGVGGRTSVWSAAGLAAAVAIGMDRFEQFLAGGHDMDRHFQDAPLEANMPVILALIGLWNIDFLGATALAVLPYDEGLGRLPAYLRQLEMESNGKSVSRDGGPIAAGTAPVVFGEPGTRGQHAFYQALHQGRQLFACDFIAPVESRHPTGDHHQ
ncbi:MAG: glucose-6-phosphate isomerase, partial [Rhodospirillales bacterium]